MATTFRAGTPAELGSLDPDQFLTWVIERAGLAVVQTATQGRLVCNVFTFCFLVRSSS